MKKMRIGFIVKSVNPVIAETIELLTRQGVEVSILCPDKQMFELSQVTVECDLYVLKSSTESALSYAGALHLRGGITLNPYPIAAQLRDKIVTTAILAKAGIPTPATYMTSTPAQLAPYLENGPLVVKPHRGSLGVGVHIIRHPAELQELPNNEFVMAQRYYPPDDPQRHDHKLFRLGDHVMGVNRIWPLRTYADKYGEPFSVSPELVEIAMRCGQVFGGIELYGVDVIMSGGQPYVVDFNHFAGYVGVPNAPQLLAAFLYEKGQRILRGEPLLPNGKDFGSVPAVKQQMSTTITANIKSVAGQPGQIQPITPVPAHAAPHAG